MDSLVDWKLIAPGIALTVERVYALWQRRRPHLPAAPLSRCGRLLGRIAVYEVTLATRDLDLSTERMKVEARDAQIAAQEVMIEALRTQLRSAGARGGLLDIPVGIPPNGIERRNGPHERRKTRSSNAITT